ncbi:MAG TPA: chorismate mutase [Alphaproteobacteria bacterium]|jgi:chorismate mutase|nr:chorismate mutase [Alphaproteobacteria bacterium]
MSSPNPSLDLLRREIDAIDVAIHDLIVKRGTIVEDIRKIKKQAGPALRPGREATILRGLAAKHQGQFPLLALVCLWREMMGGFTHMQQPFSAAVYAPPGNDSWARIARNQYGALTPLSALPSPNACVRAVAEGTTDIAVLPVPADGEDESWWTMLMGEDEKMPQIVSRLPFLGTKRGDQALVVAPWARDYSANEASLVAIRLNERASRGKVMAAMVAAGFTDAVTLATMERTPSDCFHLVEVADAVERKDARVAALKMQFDGALVEAHVIGGYARPLVLSKTTARK